MSEEISAPVRLPFVLVSHRLHRLYSIRHLSAELVKSLNGYLFMQEKGFEWVNYDAIPPTYHLDESKSIEAAAVELDRILAGRVCLPPGDR
jgi:hypothetical protein